MSEKNVVIKITATSDMSEANAELQTMKDREVDIQLQMRKMQADYQKQIALLGQNSKAADKLRDSYTKQQSQMEYDLKKTKSQLEDFSKKLSNVNDTVVDGAVKTPKLVTQLRAMKQELAKMEMEGIDPADKGFIKLAVAAGQLEDQIGDTRQRVRILSSDTKNLDAAMSVGQGLTGTFTVATSAAALFGGESEQLTKAFLKVQAALSILNGVQMIANTLNKDSAAMVVIKTALEESNTIAKVKNYTASKIQAANTILETAATEGSTVAKGASTVAQWALNSAVYAFPAVMIIAAISAIGVGLYQWTKNADETRIAQENLNKSIDDFFNSTSAEIESNDYAIELMKAQGKSKELIRHHELSNAEQAYIDADVAFKKYSKMRIDYINGDSEIEVTKEKLAEIKKVREDADNKLVELRKKYQLEDAQAITDANKKADEKAKQDKEKRNRELLAMEKELEDTRIANMDEGYAKEQAKINVDFKRKLSVIKGNSKVENDLRDELTLSRNKKIYQIDKLTTLDALSDKNTSVMTAEQIAQQKVVDLHQQTSDKVGKVIEDDMKNRLDQYNKDVANTEKAERRKMALISETSNLISTIGTAFFQIKSDQMSAESEMMSNYYTTDANEAKKNSNKKYISEKELAKKQLDLKVRQAKLDKQQALFNIGLSTAQAVLSIWAQVPKVDFGISAGLLTAFVIANGAAQAAAVMAKPLPKYAKGKKSGGKGHWATVGEVGPETMWVPDGAAIVPHGAKMDSATFKKFDIPYIPELPYVDSKWMRSDKQQIDYDKLGKAVADNVRIPKQKEVHVHVSNDGVTVRDGRGSTTHLNKKYTGSW